MANKKGTPENLRPPKTKEEARKRGTNGGIKSGVVRRRKKAFKEAAQMLLDMPVAFPNVKEQLKNLGIENDDLTNQMAIVVSMFKEAMAGNVKAAALFVDIVGTGAAGLEREERLKIEKQRLALEKKKFQFQQEGGLASGDGMPTIVNVRPDDGASSYQKQDEPEDANAEDGDDEWVK